MAEEEKPKDAVAVVYVEGVPHTHQGVFNLPECHEHCLLILRRGLLGLSLSGLLLES